MVYSVLGGAGPRSAAAPVAFSRERWMSPVKQSTTRLNFAWLASVSGACHVELDKLPDLNNTKSKISPKRLLLWSNSYFSFLFESNIKMPDG